MNAALEKMNQMNYHNIHQWVSENPHDLHQSSFQYRVSINVWVAVLGDHIFEPHVLPKTLNRKVI